MINNKYILRLLGIIFITSYIYFRFINVRLPKEIYGLSFYGFVTIFISMIISTILVYFYLKIIFNKPFKKYNNILVKIGFEGLILIKESLFAVYSYVINAWMLDGYNTLKKFVDKFYKLFGKKELLLIFIQFLPFTIINISLIVDVFVNNKLNYFYKSLILLLIPLLCRLLLHVINDVTNNLNFIEEYFIITHKYLKTGEDHFSFKIKEHISSEKRSEICKYYIPEYLFLYRFKGFVESYESKINFYKPRLMFVFYLINSFCFNYILITNLLPLN